MIVSCILECMKTFSSNQIIFIFFGARGERYHKKIRLNYVFTKNALSRKILCENFVNKILEIQKLATLD